MANLRFSRVAVALCLGAFLAAKGIRAQELTMDVDKPEPASAETIKLVQLFLTQPVPGLPVKRVPEFVAIDPETLPVKLKNPYLVKRAELLALKKVSDGRGKPIMRRIGQEPPAAGSCDGPTEMADPGSLKKMGFLELEAQEEDRLMQETKCSECELQKEFSLTIAFKPVQPGKKAKNRYFILDADPLVVLIQSWRQGRSAFGTNFFGAGHPGCR